MEQQSSEGKDNREATTGTDSDQEMKVDWDKIRKQLTAEIILKIIEVVCSFAKELKIFGFNFNPFSFTKKELWNYVKKYIDDKLKNEK